MERLLPLSYHAYPNQRIGFRNTGEFPLLLKLNHHEAIVSREDFWKVQEMMGERGVKKPDQQKKLNNDKKE